MTTFRAERFHWGDDAELVWHPKTKLFDEAQHPRDEHGRWTEGGGGDSGEQSADAQATHVREVLTAARQVAKDLGFDPKMISIGAEQSPDVKFTLNGKEYLAAGIAYVHSGPAKGMVKLFPKQIANAETAKGVAAHEIEHQKFQTALDKHREEQKQVLAEPGPPPDPNGQYYWQRRGGQDAVMTPSGSLRPPYDEKYPNYQAMENAYRIPPGANFAAADGVSDYSFMWWQAWKANTANFDQAVHETLAEMGRIKYETGKFPDHMGERILSWRGEDKPKPSQAEMNANAKLWRDLYRAVEKVYRA